MQSLVRARHCSPCVTAFSFTIGRRARLTYQRTAMTVKMTAVTMIELKIRSETPQHSPSLIIWPGMHFTHSSLSSSPALLCSHVRHPSTRQRRQTCSFSSAIVASGTVPEAPHSGPRTHLKWQNLSCDSAAKGQDFGQTPSCAKDSWLHTSARPASPAAIGCPKVAVAPAVSTRSSIIVS